VPAGFGVTNVTLSEFQNEFVRGMIEVRAAINRAAMSFVQQEQAVGLHRG